MKVLIVAGNPDVFPAVKFDKTIGVDYGSLWLLQNDYKCDIAVGDFDSVSDDEFERILQVSEVVKLQPEKDLTDLEVALDLALTRFSNAEITIIGALGGRMDHELTNIFLPTTAKFREKAEQITLMNSQNHITYLTAGNHVLSNLTDYNYIGFMQLETNDLTIENAKYPLKFDENFAAIYASNEFVSAEMTVKFDKGMLIVMRSKDKIR